MITSKEACSSDNGSKWVAAFDLVVRKPTLDLHQMNHFENTAFFSPFLLTFLIFLHFPPLLFHFASFSSFIFHLPHFPPSLSIYFSIFLIFLLPFSISSPFFLASFFPISSQKFLTFNGKFEGF